MMCKSSVSNGKSLVSISNYGLQNTFTVYSFRMRKTKHCTICFKSEPEVSFPPDKRGRWGISSWCRNCHKEKRQKWSSENPGYRMSRYYRDPKKVSDRKRDRFHGLPEGWYDEQYHKQKGLCSICGNPQSNKRFYGLCVDHSHKTGDIRGLVCSRCNHGLGQFLDNPQALRSAAAYLEAEPLMRRQL
jgi:hypothetical protein